AILTLLISSCSPKLTPFTEDLQQENGWSESELKQIQFYVSKDIILRRQATKGVSKIEHGEIKIVDGKRVEEIVIKKGTPGVFLFHPKENRFAISFESRKNDDPYLIFGPSKKANGRYTLRAKDWDSNREGGKLTYDSKTYFTPTASAYAVLLVDLKRIKDTKVKSRTAGGRKIK
ncbi:MAG: hypothetical protein ACI81W_000001, partial [Saprospiraceae bacterium]